MRALLLLPLILAAHGAILEERLGEAGTVAVALPGG